MFPLSHWQAYIIWRKKKTGKQRKSTEIAANRESHWLAPGLAIYELKVTKTLRP